MSNGEQLDQNPLGVYLDVARHHSSYTTTRIIGAMKKVIINGERKRGLRRCAILMWTCLAGCGGDEPIGPGNPVCMAGDILVSSRFTDNVLRYAAEDGAFLEVFADGGGLDNPNGIVFAGGDELYVALGDLGSVLRFDGRTGGFVSEFVAAGVGGLTSPRGLAIHPNGNLLVAGGRPDEVLEFDGASGSLVRVAASHPDLDGPVGLTVGQDGVLYVSSGITGGVFLFDANTGAFIRRVGADFPNTTGVLIDSDGALLVASGSASEVRRYDPVTGNFLGMAPRVAGFPLPSGWQCCRMGI